MHIFTKQEIHADEQKASDSLREKNVSYIKAINANISTINETKLALQETKKEKLEEISSLETRIRQLVSSETATILALEERRNSALEPITKEIQILAEEKELAHTRELSIIERERNIQTSRELINEKENKIRVTEREFENLYAKSLEELEQQKKSAESAVTLANITEKALAKNREHTTSLINELNERERSMLRAENNARAAVAAAETRIVQERKEQSATDEKRKMLAVAIKELKKRGLWNKHLEIITK